MHFNPCLGSVFLCVSMVVLAGNSCSGDEAAKPIPLFDGKTLEGWDGDTTHLWRVEQGEIVAGDLSREQPENAFLSTRKTFENFELRVKIRLLGEEGFVNSGIQFRTERIPNHHEVRGYQADFGAGYYGALYDESRRNRVLAAPTPDVLQKALKVNDWNEYRIRAEGAHIQLFLNNVQTVDYIEPEADIPRNGIIALQIHGGAKVQVRFKDITIQKLP